jgi:hypothetical protein
MAADKNFHKRIIGVCWLLLGVLILSMLATSFASLASSKVFVGALEGLLFAASGFMLLAKLPHSWRLCLPCAALSLFTVPVGTAIGVYYLWYYFRREQTS